MNIRSRILLVCCAVAIPLLCICGIIIWKEYQGLYCAAKTTVSSQCSIAVRSLAGWIHTQEKQLEALAVIPDLENPTDPENKRILDNIASTQHDWNAVLQVAPNGMTLNSSRPIDQSVQAQLLKQDFFKRVVSEQLPHVSGYVTCPVTGKPAILFGVPVSLNGKIHSVLIASVKPKAILRLFSGLGEENGSVIAVVDDNDKVLARTLANDSWTGKSFKHAKSVEHASRSVKGVFDAVGIADPILRTYAFDHLKEPMPHWIVVAGIPSQNIFG